MHHQGRYSGNHEGGERVSKGGWGGGDGDEGEGGWRGEVEEDIRAC